MGVPGSQGPQFLPSHGKAPGLGVQLHAILIPTRAPCSLHQFTSLQLQLSPLCSAAEAHTGTPIRMPDTQWGAHERRTGGCQGSQAAGPTPSVAIGDSREWGLMPEVWSGACQGPGEPATGTPAILPSRHPWPHLAGKQAEAWGSGSCGEARLSSLPEVTQTISEGARGGRK